MVQNQKLTSGVVTRADARSQAEDKFLERWGKKPREYRLLKSLGPYVLLGPLPRIDKVA